MVLEVCDVAFNCDCGELELDMRNERSFWNFAGFQRRWQECHFHLYRSFFGNCLMNKKLIPVDRYLLQLPQRKITF